MSFVLPRADGSLQTLFEALQKEWHVSKLYLFSSDEKKNKTRCIFSSTGRSDTRVFDLDILKLDRDLYRNDAPEYLAEIFSVYDIDVLCPVELPSNASIVLGITYAANLNPPAIELIRFSVQQTISRLFYKFQMEEQQIMMNQLLSEVSYMHEISRAFETTSNLDNLLEYVLSKAQELLRAESSSLMMHIREDNELEFRVVFGPKAEKVKPFRLPMGKGIAGWVAENQQPILIKDAYQDKRFDPSFDKRSGYRTRSILCVPMLHNNNTVGVMTVLNRLDKRPFEHKDKETLMLFAQQAALAVENARLLSDALEKERLHKELQVASEIQRKLIPTTIPDIPKLDIAAVYLPSKEVSGDYYDVIPVEDERFAFIVADVSGKGIPGALLVSNMQASLYAYLEENPKLEHVVTRLNDRIIKTSTPDRYITFFIGIYDTRDGRLQFVNAGHNPPLCLKKDSLESLTTGGIFVGSIPWKYESASLALEDTDVLVLFTDGLIEAMDASEEEFGEERLKEIIKRHRNESAADIQNALRQAVKKHTGGKPLDDDFTLMIIKKL